MERPKQNRNAEAGRPGAPALRFLLTEDCLAAANHGRPFTQEGLRAACRVQTSPKEKKSATPISSPEAARLCIESIWKAWLEDYKRRPDAPGRHAAAERDIAEKLKPVLLRELVANAHDACGGDSLGGKGIGLRALLRMCDRPRIHSGFLSFCFDRALAQKALAQGPGRPALRDTPLLRLPFPVARGKEPARIRALIDQFDTVIVLPFRDPKVRAEFVKQWDDFINDATTLLHLPALDRIVWERDDAVEKTRRTWVRGEGRNSVRMVDEGRRASPPRIRLRPPPKRR